MFQIAKTFLLLATLPLVWAFPARSQTYNRKNPQLVVSVYNDARIPAALLSGAQAEAVKIFARAGINLALANCPSAPNHLGPNAASTALSADLVRVGEQGSSGSTDQDACIQFDWPSHLAVRIVPGSAGSPNEVFGQAFLSPEGTGCYSDLYYDRAIALYADWNVSLTDILGSVMAHELGHLLLGSNAHAPVGIMRGRWRGEELHRAEKGSLLFTSEQAQQMRGKLIAVHPALAITARSDY